MLRLMKSEPFYAVRFDGDIHDCGSKLGFLLANVAYALDRKDLAAPLRAEIGRLLKS
jgi:UTP--glucose-1-phosphate uridylyltransferase